MSKKKRNEDLDALFGEEPAPQKTEDFAAMFEQQSAMGEDFSVGQAVRGEVIALGGDEIFVSIGASIDGIVPKNEWGSEEAKVGDMVDLQVVKITENSIRLRPKSSTAAGQVDSLEDAFDMEIPVEGLVTEEVKGGVRVKVQGVQAFCPISQIDIKRVESVEQYLGQKFEFVITQFEKRNVVVSRKKLLLMEQAETEGRVLSELKAGDVVDAKIVRVESFGAFAEIRPLVEGLIHVSELSWTRVPTAHDVVKIGDSVQVKILSIDESGDKLKISLSMKQAGMNDPWSNIHSDMPVGQLMDGSIDKKMPFGFFIRLNDGLSGLLHQSAWRDSADASSYEKLKPGAPIKVRIQRIDSENRKISLGLPGDDDDQSWRQHQSQESKSMGTFGDLLAKAQKGNK